MYSTCLLYEARFRTLLYLFAFLRETGALMLSMPFFVFPLYILFNAYCILGTLIIAFEWLRVLKRGWGVGAALNLAFVRCCSLFQVKRAHTFRRSCSIHRLGLHEKVTGYLELANAVQSSECGFVQTLFAFHIRSCASHCHCGRRDVGG